MASRYQQGNMRKGRGFRFEQRRQQMPLEVVHTDCRDVPGIGQTSRQRGTCKQCADETRPRGVSNAVEICRKCRRLCHSAPYDWQQSTNVIPRRELRHDAAEHPMQIDLAEYLMRKQAPFAIQHGDGAFIARGFNGQ
jgi:ribosomal protein L37AE/L43A